MFITCAYKWVIHQLDSWAESRYFIIKNIESECLHKSWWIWRGWKWMAIGVRGAIFDQPPLSFQNGFSGFTWSFVWDHCHLQCVLKIEECKPDASSMQKLKFCVNAILNWWLPSKAGIHFKWPTSNGGINTKFQSKCARCIALAFLSFQHTLQIAMVRSAHEMDRWWGDLALCRIWVQFVKKRPW